MKVIPQEVLINITGHNVKNYIGDIVYNIKSKEYMVIVDVIPYETSIQYVIIAFSHGVKKVRLKDVKERKVPASHTDKKVIWLNDEEAAPYLHYQKEMAEFLAEQNKTTTEPKPAPVEPNELEILTRAAKAVNAKVWKYEFEGKIFHVIAKSAFTARWKLMRKMRKVEFSKLIL